MRRRQPLKLPVTMLSVGIASIVVGLALIALRWGAPRTWVGGVVLAVSGIVLVVLGRKKRPRRSTKPLG